MLTIDIAAEVEALGLFAACCDVWSCNPSTPPRERERLASRAERYRELQLDALEQYKRNRK
jgi:hypothetical protein